MDDAAQRVTLIRRIAQGLAQLSVDEVNLLLHQFGFDWHPFWDDYGTTENYTFRQLESGCRGQKSVRFGDPLWARRRALQSVVSR